MLEPVQADTVAWRWFVPSRRTVRQGWLSKTRKQNVGHFLDFVGVSAYPFLRVKKKYFLNPRQFACVSGLLIILDSPVNQFRYTRSASYASK